MLCLGALLAAAVAPWSAQAVSPDVVISQVYGGGGNSGATYKNDFIELYNRGSSAVSLNGWSVQYASATGTTWAVTNLTNFTLQPGQYYLIQEAIGAAGTVNLPTPDATGTIALAGAAGKVALVTSTTALACGATCATNAAVKDFVGFGTTANNFEGSGPTPAPSNTTAVLRAGNGATDTDNNATDFSAGAPNPRNSAVSSTVNGACGGDNGLTLAANAPTLVCSAGTASAITGTGHPWNWNCAGSNGGTTASCSATIQSYSISFASDANGTLTGTTAQTVDYGAPTTAVTANANAGYTFLNWTGTGGFATTTANPLTLTNVTAAQNITANFTAAAVNAGCGADNGLTLAAAPTNLCGVGTASPVTGSGPWNWSCAGLNGGNPASCSASFKGPFAIFHVNDTHARLTPHKWIIPSRTNTTPVYEDVGGAAFVAGKMLAMTAANANALVIDAGDISEGNPIGDFGGSTSPLTINGYTLSGCAPIPAGGTGSSNCGMTQFYQLLSKKLQTTPGRGGRGMDAVVVGNHDVRDLSYIQNLDALQASGVPVLSVNVRDIATHTPHFAPYQIVTVNGTKVGILGYTTSAAQVGASLASTLEVVDCDWSGTAAPCHLSDYVNTLRNVEHVDVVVLVAHIGHGALVDQNPLVGPNLLVDNGVAKLPEVVVTGHWHTWAETVWQPMELNYKTIFTESGSYMKYIGELNVDTAGKYLNATQHVMRNADIIPDTDVQALVTNLTGQYDAAHPGLPSATVIGYTDDNLVLDNDMRWWSPDEYPWSGNNTAGQWIVDGMKWKCAQLFGACDLAIEAGGGVRSDIPAGPVTLTQVYETFPWSDDTFYRINMSGQDLYNFLKETNLNAGFSRELHVTAVDGVPTSVLFNGQPINLAQTYTVAINNYMYAHPPSGYVWTDAAPLTSTALVRDGLIEFMQTQHGSPATAYNVGGPRYEFNGEFSGGYRMVVTMIDDHLVDGVGTRPTFGAAFVRMLSATPETLLRRGGKEVPANLVNADGSVNSANRLSSQEIYRSHLGFKPGALVSGDIVEFWGKANFYGGNPEFVDQEGIIADGVEFNILGHDESLAKPTYVASIGALLNDNYKNQYVRFLATQSATASTVTDQNGQSLKIWDKTGYAAKSLTGGAGSVLELTGVLTMESYGFRFRCDTAVVSSAALPAKSEATSSIDPLNGVASAPITLTATAAISGGYDLSPVADAQVASASNRTASNYGAGTNLYVQSSLDNTGITTDFGNERTWLRFDLSSIPAASSITGATLKLWNWKSAGASLPVEVLGSTTDSWLESGITWANQPATGGVLDTVTLASGASNLWYNWNVTAFTQSQFAGDKLVSLLAKAVTENSTDATAPSYAFDAKEFGSNVPVLHVTTTGNATAVASVKFFYRYSADNLNWGTWTQTGVADTVAPYSTAFSFPSGVGYYEFYSVATDNLNVAEATPAFAQAAVHYQAASGTAQTISFPALGDLSVGSAASLPAATASSGLPVIFNSLTSSVCTVTGNLVSAIAVGTCTIEAVQAGDPGYLLPASLSRTFAVQAIGQTIAFAALADRALGSGSFVVGATATSSLGVQFSSLTASVCTVSGNTVSLVATGTCTIAADQAGDASYAAAPTVTQSFQVTAAASTSDSGDVPIPGWALAALGAGLLGAMRRRAAVKQQD